MLIVNALQIPLFVYVSYEDLLVSQNRSISPPLELVLINNIFFERFGCVGEIDIV